MNIICDNNKNVQANQHQQFRPQINTALCFHLQFQNATLQNSTQQTKATPLPFQTPPFTVATIDSTQEEGNSPLAGVREL